MEPEKIEGVRAHSKETIKILQAPPRHRTLCAIRRPSGHCNVTHPHRSCPDPRIIHLAISRIETKPQRSPKTCRTTYQPRPRACLNVINKTQRKERGQYYGSLMKTNRKQKARCPKYTNEKLFLFDTHQPLSQSNPTRRSM